MCKCISREFKKFSHKEEALQPQISHNCSFETWQSCEDYVQLHAPGREKCDRRKLK